MDLGNLVNKYKSIKFEPIPTLFEPDYRDIKSGMCPRCHCKLYEMNEKFLYCKSKKCRQLWKKTFIVSKSKCS